MGITNNEKRLLTRWELICMIGGVSLAGPAFAEGWRFTPQVTAQEVFTDNVELDPQGSEQSDFVTELTPAVTAEGHFSRFRADLDLALQNLIYYDDSARNKILPLASGTALAEIVRDHGFVDFSFGYSPQNVSSRQGVALDNINASDRLQILRYSISPRWTHTYRNYAIGTVGYRYGEVISGDSAVFADSTSNSIFANLHNGNHFSRFFWDVNFNDDRIEEDGATDETRFREFRGRGDYFFTTHWAVIGELGYEDNSFGSDNDEFSGPLYATGLKWSPSRLTSMELIRGDRFFGSYWQARASHTGRRVRLGLSYTEEPELSRQRIVDSVVFPVLDAFGQPIISPITGQPENLLIALPDQRVSEVLLSRNLSANAAYTGREHFFEVGFRREVRDIQNSALGNDFGDEVFGTTGAWEWRFTPRSRTRVAMEYIDEEFRDGSSGQFYIFDLAYTRRFGRYTDATIGARHFERVAEGALQEFEENRIFASLFTSF